MLIFTWFDQVSPRIRDSLYTVEDIQFLDIFDSMAEHETELEWKPFIYNIYI